MYGKSLILLNLYMLCLLNKSTYANTQESNASTEQDIYTQAAGCPYRFNMGCTLDVLEKACTGLQEVEGCTKNGKCDDVGELDRLIGALVPKASESINKCCCTKAYKKGGYEKCDTPNPVCKESVEKYITNDEGYKHHFWNLRRCAKKPSVENCEKAIPSIKWAMKAVQQVRGVMWPVKGCEMLAPTEPFSECGWDVKPEGRAIGRADLYCDAIIWQYKEMGASDPFMAQCKDAPIVTPTQQDEGDEEEQEEGEEEEREEPNHEEEQTAGNNHDKSDL